MCSAIKYPYPPQGLEFPGGGGGGLCKIKTFEETYEAWLEFPEGCEVFLELHSQCKETNCGHFVPSCGHFVPNNSHFVPSVNYM